MYIKQVTNNIWLDHTYSTFKRLEKQYTYMGKKYEQYFSKIQTCHCFLLFFGYVSVHVRRHNK